LSASIVTRIDQTAFAMFWENLIYGYQTLDLLAGIFFSAIIITLLKQKAGSREKASTKKLASISFFSGLIGLTLLALVYGGLSFLGAYFGHGLEHINEGELFSF